MRNAFADEIFKLRSIDPRIMLLSGDIGNRLFNPFKERFGASFLNCGIAEANMTGVAAGLALSGMRPFTYTITTFNTLRCLEQIKIDICAHQLPVTIVGTGSGLAYADQGFTHHSMDDLAVLRVIPNLTIVSPADTFELRGALQAAIRQSGPVYLRIGKKNEPVVHNQSAAFQFGKGITLQEGQDVCLLGTGTMVAVAEKAAELIKSNGWSVQVVSMHTIKPIDEQLLSDVFSRCRVVATLEEHSGIGGLHGAVAEWMSSCTRPHSKYVKFCTPDRFLHKIGNQNEARRALGLDPDSIANTILHELDQIRTHKINAA